MIGSPNKEIEAESIEELIDIYDKKYGKKTDIMSAKTHICTFLEERGIKYNEITEEDAIEFSEYLKSLDVKSETSGAYYGMVRRMVGWHQVRGVVDYNPFAMADDQIEFEESETTKREVDLEELRDAIYDIQQPRLLTAVVLLLKTGLRLSEATNLDYRDINLDHEISEIMPSPRAEIRQNPDTIYVDSKINEGKVYNGEVRHQTNKKKSTRKVPIDEELKQTLAWWIAMSPPTQSPAKPLFRKSSNGFGDRVKTTTLWHDFVDWAQDHNWHEWEGEMNITPHWCRHWFVTVLRNNIDQNEVERGNVRRFVKGLRGDSDADTIDIYTHEWGDNQWQREAYVNNIPSLFVPSQTVSHYKSLIKR